MILNHLKVTIFVTLIAHFVQAQMTCIQFLTPFKVATIPAGSVKFSGPSQLIQETSEATYKRFKKSQIKAVENQLKSLSYKQALQTIAFQNGEVFVEAGHLFWRHKNGFKQLLVRKEEHPERTIKNILISPDGEKIAYSTTLNDSDQNFWYVKSLTSKPKMLLKKPILVRIDGFSWGQDSETLYYSHFSPLKKAMSGAQPIQVVRSRNIVTEEDKLVFDHGFKANFAVQDIDQGKVLIAHRVLGPASGIKTSLLIYKGVLQSNGTYKWTALIRPNKYLGHFLGIRTVRNKQYVVMQNDRFSKRYGISMVSIDDPSSQVFSEQRNIFVPEQDFVLHNSQMHDGKIFLEYYNSKKLTTSLKVFDLERNSIINNLKFSDFDLKDHGAMSLPVSFDGAKVSFKYTDVLGNARVFVYNPIDNTFSALKNPEKNPFDTTGVKIVPFSYFSEDGTEIYSLKIFKTDQSEHVTKPKFFLIKSYGMIGIKHVAEATEAQMTLLRGGVYVVPDIRGGAGPSSDFQKQGAQNFELRFSDVRALSHHITELDPDFSRFNLKAEDSVIIEGRSYMGSGTLTIAALYSRIGKMFFSIVPVWDAEQTLIDGRFGIFSHSDRFPDPNSMTGDLDIHTDFLNEVKKYNPARLLERIPKGTKLYVYTGGLDDRVDQYQIEDKFVRRLLDHLGSDFQFIQDPKASHGTRWYFKQMFMEIDLVFP
jgi:hypothetical protein